MKKTLALAATLALSAGLLTAAPASAARWTTPNQLRVEINQLDRQIDRTRGLSRREEARLERRVDSLQALYRSYARGGFSGFELRSLGREVDAVKAELARQAHDRNGRRFDRHDRHRN